MPTHHLSSARTLSSQAASLRDALRRGLEDPGEVYALVTELRAVAAYLQEAVRQVQSWAQMPDDEWAAICDGEDAGDRPARSELVNGLSDAAIGLGVAEMSLERAQQGARRLRTIRLGGGA